MRRKLYRYFLLFFTISGIITPLPAGDWIEECIEYTIHTRFDQAIEVVNNQLLLDPQNYRAYFYLAATLSSKMTHFENDVDKQNFKSAIDSTIDIIESKLDSMTDIEPKPHVDYLFYLGSAYGYLAFFQGRTGSYFPALSNGLESNSLLNLAVVIDSTLYDAYLGIGIFKYWRYSKLKFISWLPFIPDERDMGIEYIKKTIAYGSKSKYMAMHQLVYILCDYGYPEDAIPYAEQIVKKYPDSQFMWWAASRAYDKSDDFENAIFAYNRLNSIISTDPNPNPNHLYKCHLKLVEIYQRKNDYQSCQDTCQNLLVLLDEITITDRDDKIDDIRDMLSECMEKNQEHNKISN